MCVCGVFQAMFLPVVYSLARTFRETVITRKEPEMIELYGKIAWLTIIMWAFYPIVWLFSEGFASFSVSFEVTASPALDQCWVHVLRPETTLDLGEGCHACARRQADCG